MPPNHQASDLAVDQAAAAAPVAVPDPPVATSHPSTRYSLLAAVGSVHVLNDMMQSVILAIYPLLKGGFDLGFSRSARSR